MREEMAVEPVLVDADTTAAQQFVGGLIEQTFTMDDLIVDRWMGVGVSVRLTVDASEDVGITVAGHNGPTTAQEFRDILQMAIDTLDETQGTSLAVEEAS